MKKKIPTWFIVISTGIISALLFFLFGFLYTQSKMKKENKETEKKLEQSLENSNNIKQKLEYKIKNITEKFEICNEKLKQKNEILKNSLSKKTQEFLDEKIYKELYKEKYEHVINELKENKKEKKIPFIVQSKPKPFRLQKPKIKIPKQMLLREKIKRRRLRIEKRREPQFGYDITVYVTKTGSKYHRGNCSYLNKSKMQMGSRKAKRSYGRCSRCNPF